MEQVASGQTSLVGVFSLERHTMAKKKKAVKEAPGFYKGYDIKWLKGIGKEHPDFNLVAESGFFDEVEEPAAEEEVEK